MLLYFKKHEGVNFIDLVLSGQKIHTCRQSKIPKVGGVLFLRCGRSLAEAVCNGNQEISLNENGIYVGGRNVDREKFAINGGFSNYESAFRFYGNNYNGFIIHFTNFRY